MSNWDQFLHVVSSLSYFWPPVQGFLALCRAIPVPHKASPLADLLIINWSPFQCLPSLGFYFTNSPRQAGSHTLRLLFFFCLNWFVYRAFWLLLFILDPDPPPPPPNEKDRISCRTFAVFEWRNLLVQWISTWKKSQEKDSPFH